MSDILVTPGTPKAFANALNAQPVTFGILNDTDVLRMQPGINWQMWARISSSMFTDKYTPYVVDNGIGGTLDAYM